jgi:flagellar hook-length control protein FliK
LPVEAGEAQKEASPMEQVVRAARAQIGAGRSQVRLQLQPPELGQLRIDVRLNGKTIQMHVQTQTETTHHIVSSRISDLRSALEAQGLTVEHLRVELRGPHQTSSSANQQDHSGLENPLDNTHPDAHRGGHSQSESEPDLDHSEAGPEHFAGGDDEEDVPSPAATEAGVNVIA